MSQRYRVRALPGWALALLYLSLTIGQVVAAALWGGANAHNPLPFIARGLGLTALAMMLMQFVTSGRFETISGRLGLDRIMGFHRTAATAVLVALLLHVSAFSLSGRVISPESVLNRFVANLTSADLMTGTAALILLGLIILGGRHLRGGSLPYPIWRLTHGAGAVLASVLALNHAVTHARYIADPYAAGAIGLLVLIAALSIISVYVVRPLRASRHGFRVESARALTPNISELVLAQPATRHFRFAAGQFAWLTIGRSSPIGDNPFSIASAPSDLPNLRFLIRGAGDMSRNVAEVVPGTLVGLDGPHGSFTLDAAGPGPILMIAGGIGIAPILGLLRELEAGHDRRPIRLLAAARSATDHVARAEILSLAQTLDLQTIFVVDEGNADDGLKIARCTPELVAEVLSKLDPAQCSAFLCGPPRMMDMAVASVLTCGVPPKAIVMERFDYGSARDRISARIHLQFVALLAAVLLGAATVSMLTLII